MDYFSGAMSFFVSSYAAHEFAHAGAQTRMFGRMGQLIPKDKVFDDEIHPQIFKFQERYVELFNQAFLRGVGNAAFILVIDQDPGLVDLVGYRAKLYEEARQFGLEELKVD